MKRTPEELGDRIHRDFGKWRALVASAGIRVE
jgi:hypothetical protein